jgi:hypothetical protein
MINHPLRDICKMIEEQTESVGIARNSYLAKKAEKRNLEARLKKNAEGSSQTERSMNADATDEWLTFEKELNRLEAIYEFQSDKLEVLNKEFQAQYQELKMNQDFLKTTRGAG